RSIWPVLDQTQKTLPSHRSLLHSVTELRFEYLDRQGKFQNNWPSADNKQDIFPRAIRITLQLKNWGTLSQLFLISQTMKPQMQTLPQEQTQTPERQGNSSQQLSPTGQPANAYSR